MAFWKYIKYAWPWLAGAFWWLADHIWGDKIFAWIKPLIPAQITELTARDILTWGPPAILVLIGIFIAFKKTKPPENSKIPNLALSPTSTTVVKRDIKMHQALVFVGTGKWKEGPYRITDYPEVNRPTELMREAAKYGEIKVWGKSSHHNKYDLIPADYWKIWQIDCYSNPEGECQTDVSDVTNWSGGIKYFELMVSKAEIENKWPPKNETAKEPKTGAPTSIQKALTHKDWVLNFNPVLQGKHKRISFDDDGTIGKGRNDNEYKWKINGPTLEIWRENGDLQNRFIYHNGDERFICTNDLEAYGIPKQIIYRFKNQNGIL